MYFILQINLLQNSLWEYLSHKLFSNKNLRFLVYLWSTTFEVIEDIEFVHWKKVSQKFCKNPKYTFFNPKFGLTYRLNTNFQLYGSFAVAHREPVRADFVDAPMGEIPSPQQLQNFEFGFKGNLDNIHLESNLYLMDYTNQLILTGAVNDVGSSIRVNTPDSYRAGIEMVLAMD